ncbi:hypothetical protein M6B38_347765 [Iris pallida]|uniref:Uncharacterized protein n=1 Tax=Iris pallida TaxID=29817 RepID=A0AAX6GS67_IRIPA|nr:hypothetical protein M6B38_347765 [Iris pallida]
MSGGTALRTATRATVTGGKSLLKSGKADLSSSGDDEASNFHGGGALSRERMASSSGGSKWHGEADPSSERRCRGL